MEKIDIRKLMEDYIDSMTDSTNVSFNNKDESICVFDVKSHEVICIIKVDALLRLFYYEILNEELFDLNLDLIEKPLVGFPFISIDLHKSIYSLWKCYVSGEIKIDYYHKIARDALRDCVIGEIK